MPRELKWIEKRDFEGFGCSQCSWVFRSTGPLNGTSLEDAIIIFEAERDKAFAAHDCGQHAPRERGGEKKP
jgi:hypothetical protein